MLFSLLLFMHFVVSSTIKFSDGTRQSTIQLLKIFFPVHFGLLRVESSNELQQDWDDLKNQDTG